MCAGDRGNLLPGSFMDSADKRTISPACSVKEHFILLAVLLKHDSPIIINQPES